MAKAPLDWQTIFDEVFGETKEIGGDWDWSEVKDEDDLAKIAKELVEQGYFATYEEAYEKAKEKYKEWQENQEGEGESSSTNNDPSGDQGDESSTPHDTYASKGAEAKGVADGLDGDDYRRPSAEQKKYPPGKPGTQPEESGYSPPGPVDFPYSDPEYEANVVVDPTVVPNTEPGMLDPPITEVESVDTTDPDDEDSGPLATERGGLDGTCRETPRPPPALQKGATLFNEETIVYSESTPTVFNALFAPCNDSKGCAYQFIQKSLNSGEPQQQGMDPIRLFTGRLWLPRTRTEMSSFVEGVDMVGSIYKQGLANQPALGFFTYKKDCKYVESNPGQAHDFYELYHQDSIDGLTKGPLGDRMKLISLGNPENSGQAGTIYPPEGVQVTSGPGMATNTGVRERIVISTPKRTSTTTFQDSITLQNDFLMMKKLLNQINDNIVSKPLDQEEGGFGAPRLPRPFYDYVSKYSSPPTNTSAQNTSAAGDTNDNLVVQGKSIYQGTGPLQTYIEAISKEEITESMLPSSNIATMFSLYDPKASFEGEEGSVPDWSQLEEDISPLTGEAFEQYEQYVTLFGTLDMNNTLQEVPDWFGDYIYKWSDAINQMSSDNQVLQQQILKFNKRYGDIIFPYLSSIRNGLQVKDLRAAFPLRNQIMFNLPKLIPGSKVIPGVTGDPANLTPSLSGYISGRALMGDLEGNRLIESNYFDHMLLTRYSDLMDAVVQNSMLLAYPYKNENLDIPVTSPNAQPGKAYWWDFDSKYNPAVKKTLLYTPDINPENTPATSFEKRFAINYLELLQNVLQHGEGIYSYDDEGSSPDRYSISLLRSFNLTKEPLLRPIESPEINQTGIPRHTNRIMTNIFSRYGRTFAEILDGQMAASQTVGFIIRKFKMKADGSGPEDPLRPMSTYYVSNYDSGTAEDKISEFFEFVDSRVKYQQAYHYEINALHMVLGTKYVLQNIHRPRPGDPHSNPIVYKKAQGTSNQDGAINESQWCEISIDVDSFPHIKIIELPYDTKTLTVSDKPPVGPEIEPVPYRAISNKVLFLLRPGFGQRVEIPVMILEGDKEKFTAPYQAQYPSLSPTEALNIAGTFAPGNQATPNVVDIISQAYPLEFSTDDPTVSYQMFRLSRPPESYEDFKNSEKILDIAGEYSTSTSYEDDIQANHKYYYIFRCVDIQGNISNPTPVYEIRLVDDKGTVFIETKIYKFKQAEKSFSKPMKRFISIQPALNQRKINLPGSGLQPMGDEGADEPILATPQWDDIALGVEDESVFSLKTANKKLKVRLISKKTKKKLDINLNFDIERHPPVVELPPLELNKAEDDTKIDDENLQLGGPEEADLVPPEQQPGEITPEEEATDVECD